MREGDDAALDELRGANARAVDVVGPPTLPGRIGVETPCRRGSVDPSAWTLIMSAASRRLQKRARAMFPPCGRVKSSVVRVIATRKPRSRSALRVRFEIASTTEASPAVPPPSLIFRMDEPGPIRSVERFGRRA